MTLCYTIIMKKRNYKQIGYKIGQNLARIRIEQGLTHLDMSIYGISSSYYGKVELGKCSPTLDFLYKVSKIFQVPLHSLFLDKEGNPINQ